jgi:hypothetical protein
MYLLQLIRVSKRSLEMQADRALNEPTLQLPQELLSELARRGVAPRTDMGVEGWKPSLFGRLIELVTGRRAPRR